MNIQPLRVCVCSIQLVFFLINYPSSSFGSIFSEGRHIMKGRDALLDSNPEAALPNFMAITQSNPNYINCAQGLCIGIWTYLGRTYHELGKNQKALVSLKKGKGRNSKDRFNKIYLGLVMAQTGQTKEGTVELDAGLKALGAWLSSSAGRGSTAQFWDPGGERRCPEFSWKWLVATDIKHHYFSLVNQFFRLCGRFCSSVFAL